MWCELLCITSVSDRGGHEKRLKVFEPAGDKELHPFCVAVYNLRRCTPEVVGGYFSDMPGIRQVIFAS